MKRSPLSSVLLNGLIPGVLVSLLAAPSGLVAQAPQDDHIVSPQALQQQVELSSAERQQDIATVTAFLSTPVAERTMRDSHIDAVQIRTAIPALSDAELKDLASRSADAQQKFAAGEMTSALLVVVIVAAVAVLFITVLNH